MFTNKFNFNSSEAFTVTRETFSVVESEGDKVAPGVVEEARKLETFISHFSSEQLSDYKAKKVFDGGVDTVYHSSYKIFVAFEEFYSLKTSLAIPLTEEEAQKRKCTGVILNKVFTGKTNYTTISWRKQFGLMGMLLNRVADPEVQTCIETLGMGYIFDRLQRAYQKYGVVMGFSFKDTDKTALENMDDWHSAMDDYLAAVRYLHKDDPEIQDKLTEPYTKMIESIKESRRRKKKKLQEEKAKKEQDTFGF